MMLLLVLHLPLYVQFAHVLYRYMYMNSDYRVYRHLFDLEVVALKRAGG